MLCSLYANFYLLSKGMKYQFAGFQEVLPTRLWHAPVVGIRKATNFTSIHTFPGYYTFDLASHLGTPSVGGTALWIFSFTQGFFTIIFNGISTICVPMCGGMYRYGTEKCHSQLPAVNLHFHTYSSFFCGRRNLRGGYRSWSSILCCLLLCVYQD